MADDNGQRAAMARGMQPKNIARDGAPKNTAAPATVPGQVRQTKGEPAAYHHGITTDDLPNSKIVRNHEKPTGYHTANTDAQIVKSANHPTAGQVLADAARLGKPPEKA